MTHECVRCGACCRWPGYVRVSAREIDAMAHYLGISPTVFVQQYTFLTQDRRSLSLTERADGACIFLTAENLCRIHAVKPAQCRAYPDGWNFAGYRELCRARVTGPEVSPNPDVAAGTPGSDQPRT